MNFAGFRPSQMFELRLGKIFFSLCDQCGSFFSWNPICYIELETHKRAVEQMLWLQRMRKKMNLKFDFTINYKNKLKSKRGERVRIRLWLRWLRSARTLILIVQMSDCYLSVVSLLCVCIEWRIFFCMPFPTTQKQTRWKRKTRKNCPKERERERFFLIISFFFFPKQFFAMNLFHAHTHS